MLLPIAAAHVMPKHNLCVLVPNVCPDAHYLSVVSVLVCSFFGPISTVVSDLLHSTLESKPLVFALVAEE